MVSTQTCWGSSNTVASLQRRTTFSWVTTWTEGNSPWKPSASYWPTKSNTQRTFSCSEATMSVLPSTASTGSTMSVGRRKSHLVHTQMSQRCHQYRLMTPCVWLLWQVSAGSTSSCGRPSLTALTASLLLLSLMRRSSAAMEVREQHLQNLTWRHKTLPCLNLLNATYVLTPYIPVSGLSPDLQSMEQIRRIMRPTDVPDTGGYFSLALQELSALLFRVCPSLFSFLTCLPFSLPGPRPAVWLVVVRSR